MKTIMKQAWVVCLMPVLFSCATYNSKLSRYYSSVQQADYAKADEQLSANRFLQADRNRLLLYMEKGKLYHLRGSYDSSNLYFNLADNFIENKRKTTGDRIVGNLLNPMMETYLGEDYERFLIHYYKALNYLYKGAVDDAVVEARRITLSTNAQQQKFSPTSTRYTEDAFALMVQGLLYETSGDVNNAFISYRNAANLFLDARGPYYGVACPEQLKNDLLRTADQLGFADQLDVYQKKWNKAYTKTEASEGGELVVFFERGMAPAKTEQNFVLTNSGNGSDFFFTSQYGTFNVPFDYNYANRSRNDFSLNRFRTIRVAVPSYVQQPYEVARASVTVNGKRQGGELIEDLNTLAPAVLKERIVQEVSKALVRQVVKKLTEAGASATAKEVSKNNSKEKDESKKKANAEMAALTTGLLVNIFNTATEKADTRNWQSLPAYIQYVRVPLQKGENNVQLQIGRQTKTVIVNGNGNLQLLNWIVMR
ncbi:COG3014 family protein [Sediminibacterium roseum]|nr:hypothetical protein [Sediminibacterium roseum]